MASTFRTAVLRRAGYQCEALEHGTRCEVRGAPLLEAHHVQAIVDGGDPIDPANGAALCRRHHRMLEAQTHPRP